MIDIRRKSRDPAEAASSPAAPLHAKRALPKPGPVHARHSPRLWKQLAPDESIDADPFSPELFKPRWWPAPANEFVFEPQRPTGLE
jgi:hypothetical protein